MSDNTQASRQTSGSAPSRTTLYRWLGLVTVLLLIGAGVAWWWTRPVPPPPPMNEIWKITSVRVGEDPSNPGNLQMLAPGDRLLAFANAMEEPCFAFLQDRVKFETSFSESNELDNGGLLQDVVGIQLGKGSGQVRMVILCAPTAVDDLTSLLQASNLLKFEPDERLRVLMSTLTRRPGFEKARALASRWYVLNPNAPPVNPATGQTTQGGIQGAPALETPTPAALVPPGGASPSAAPALPAPQ